MSLYLKNTVEFFFYFQHYKKYISMYVGKKNIQNFISNIFAHLML